MILSLNYLIYFVHPLFLSQYNIDKKLVHNIGLHCDHKDGG